MRGVFSSFYLPHFLGNLRWEVSTETSLKINKSSKLVSLPWMMEEACSFGFSWLLPSYRAWAYCKRSWKHLKSSWILSNRSYLAFKRVIAPNHSASFLLLTRPISALHYFEPRSLPSLPVALRCSKRRSAIVPSGVWSGASLRFFWESNERCSLDRLLRADLTHRWCGSQM